MGDFTKLRLVIGILALLLLTSQTSLFYSSSADTNCFENPTSNKKIPENLRKFTDKYEIYYNILTRYENVKLRDEEKIPIFPLAIFRGYYVPNFYYLDTGIAIVFKQKDYFGDKSQYYLCRDKNFSDLYQYLQQENECSNISSIKQYGKRCKCELMEVLFIRENVTLDISLGKKLAEINSEEDIKIANITEKWLPFKKSERYDTCKNNTLFSLCCEPILSKLEYHEENNWETITREEFTKEYDKIEGKLEIFESFKLSLLTIIFSILVVFPLTLSKFLIKRGKTFHSKETFGLSFTFYALYLSFTGFHFALPILLIAYYVFISPIKNNKET